MTGFFIKFPEKVSMLLSRFMAWKVKYSINIGIVRHFYSLIRKLFAFNSRVGLHHLNARILFLIIKINTIYWKKKIGVNRENKAVRVLAFNREGFWKDLIEIDKRTDIDIIYFPQLLYTLFAEAFIPLKLRSQLAYHVKNPNKTFTSKWIEREVSGFEYDVEKDKVYKAAFRCGVDGVIDTLKSMLDFNLIVSSNVQYYQDQEWMNSSKERNIPYFVLCKEGLGNKTDFANQINTFLELDFHYKGDKVAVHCQAVVDILIRGGVLNKEDVFVTGTARTDTSFHSFKNRLDREGSLSDTTKEKWVVFFDFYHYNAMPLGGSFKGVKKLWMETVNGILDVAENCKDSNIKFVIKTKLSVNTEELLKMHGDRIIGMRNVLYGHAISFDDVAEKATMIIGNRSVALIEFMFTNIPILIVNWAETLENPSFTVFSNEESNAYIEVGSKEELAGVVTKYIGTAQGKLSFDLADPVVFARYGIIEEHLYRIDGKRAEAVGTFIHESLDSFWEKK